MRDYVELSGTPVEEDCEQVGPNCNYQKMRLECMAFIEQLRRQAGKEPEGARLAVKGNDHDFGHYYEVVCYYNPSMPSSLDYAWGLEANLPAKWDDAARRYLAENSAA